MSCRVKNSTEPTSIDVKRFYPPFEVESDCPECGETFVGADDSQYLSYPVVNGEERVSFWCEECDAEWNHVIRITVKAEVVR